MDHLFDKLYHLEVPPRPRTTPMRVLAVGPSRSGTGSLREALHQLGFRHAYHGVDTVVSPADDVVWHELHLLRARRPLTAPDFDRVLGHSAAVTDHCAAAFALDLAAAYPDALVVLNVRGVHGGDGDGGALDKKDAEAWRASVARTLLPLHRSRRFWLRTWFCAELYWVRRGFMRGTWDGFYGAEFERDALAVLERHVRAVRAAVAPSRLLEWDPRDGWEPLCRFLDVPLPTPDADGERPFPRLHTGSNYESLFRRRMARAERNMHCCLAVVLAGVGAGAAAAWYVVVSRTGR